MTPLTYTCSITYIYVQLGKKKKKTLNYRETSQLTKWQQI